MNVTYELSLLQLTVANQAKELELLKQQVAELSAPKQHDYSRSWKTKEGTLLSYNEMKDHHLFCAIQRCWTTSPSLAPLLKEAQARWRFIEIEDSVDHYKFFEDESVVSDLLSEEYMVGSSLRRKATVLAYRSLKAAGVEVTLTI